MTQPLSNIPTTDDRWLAFAERTADVIAAHPHLLPIRQAIFKDFIERKTTLSRQDQLKSLARLALKRQHSQGDFSPVDVVFWLKSSREVVTEAVLPVQAAVQAHGLKTTLIDDTNEHIFADTLTPPPVRFQIAYQPFGRSKWQNAWNDLRACLPDDLSASSYDAFRDLGFISENCVEEAVYVLSQLKPRLLVVLVDQLLSDSAACVAAKKLGIPSLVLLHGAVSPYNAPLTADQMGVWGQVAQEQMMDLGVPADQLAILGSPRHDQFKGNSSATVKQDFCQLLSLPDLPLMVFFSNGNDPRRNSYEAVEGCAAWLEQAAAQLDGQMAFAVRLHPNEDGSFYQDCPHLHVFKKECDLATTLAAADICGALCSTTLIDSLLYRKPVLQFYADGWPHLADNWQRGLAQRISSATELTQTLEMGLEHNGWEALAAEQYALVDTVFANRGHAVQAVADYIAQQVGQTR